MRTRRRLLVAALGAAALVAALDTPAAAHPLGNFTVNHLDQLSVAPDGVTNDAIVDLAEIPTAQAEREVDRDGDGRVSTAELDAHAAAECTELASAQTLAVDGAAVALAVVTASFEYRAGEAGLPTSRLECRVHGAVELDGRHAVTFHNDYAADRIGWREIVAAGSGLDVVASDVPASSATRGLEVYPDDLLSAPPDVVDARFGTAPAAATSVTTGAPAAAAPSSADDGEPGGGLAGFDAGPLGGFVDRVQRMFDDLIGRRDLTWPVGLLAVGLAALLGASHALLPGHGKTIMAAYIAGRAGHARDAVIVGATVTGTHTGGVLVLGLALTLSTGLAGEVVIAWLGLASGLLVLGLGVALLVGLVRRRSRFGLSLEQHHHGPYGHSHRHHDHDHDHDRHDHHPAGEEHRHGRHELAHVHEHHVDAHGPGGHRHGAGHVHDVVAQHAYAVAGVGGRTLLLDHVDPAPVLERRDELDERDERHDDRGTDRGEQPYSRLGLVGMGIAGGMVPSPSALIILLSAIALGRTAFGVLLVVFYGVGMAATLTAAGVLLVVVRDRYLHTLAGRLAASGRRWTRIAPYGTAALVIVVGLGLALRSVSGI